MPAPPTTAERFATLADLADAAGERGNYAIAALFVVRAGGREIACAGENSVFTHHDPTGHAEINALRTAARRAAGVEELDDGVVIVRDAAGERDETTLYATLEPCPMCTVAIINARPDRVVIAVEDPPSGAMQPDRLAALPPLWGELARSIEISFCQSERPDEPATYLPAALAQRLTAAFLDSRERLDHVLAERGVIERSAVLSQRAQA